MFASDLFKYKQKGNGVILIWKNRFVFAVGRENFWDKTTKPWVITYTNIGGKVEPGENMINATKREVMEESGCEVEIIPSNRTLFCNLEDSNLTEYDLRDEIPPLLIYNSDVIKMSVSVYKARIINKPEPYQEVPALLFLPTSILKGGLLTELIKKGATLKKQPQIDIPRTALFLPFGSAELLAKNYDQFNIIANFNEIFE